LFVPVPVAVGGRSVIVKGIEVVGESTYLAWWSGRGWEGDGFVRIIHEQDIFGLEIRVHQLEIV
jgi:hypothetical protein